MPLVPGEDERAVTLVLCDRRGAVLGQLEPVVVRPRYWPETGVVVDAVLARDGLDIVVLRLLRTGGGYAGGRVSYLAELRGDPPARLAPVEPASAAAAGSDPAHRQWWAEPGSLTTLPDWVDQALEQHGRRRTGPLRQRKTWNLSLLLTAPTAEGDVWVKATPPFLADEGGVLARVRALDPALVPGVLARDPARRLVLMDHVPGTDQWGLHDEAVIDAMVARWVAVQRSSTGDVGHLVALGAADLRAASLVPDVEAVAERPESRAALTRAQLEVLDRLVEGLAARLAEVAACGLPDTLVHGDLHPGNWRRAGERLTLLDWGDAGVGSPVLDMRAFVERLDGAGLQQRVRSRWAARWQEAVPGSDAARAAVLMAPVAELAAAATYQRFLDHIEVTERVYHDHDPVDRLRAAVAVGGGA